jgi:protein phosphatase
VTRDHTVVQDLLDRGELTTEEATQHPEAHVITRAVGGDDHLEVDVVSAPLQAGDWLLLCSDGLTGCLFDQQIAQALAESRMPDDACRRLLREALEAGASDNVSVIAVQMQPS